MAELPNFRNLMYLSCAFFFLFFAFGSASNIVTQSLNNLGFGNLGYHSLSVLYLFFAIFSLFSSTFVYKFKPKKSLIISALTYGAWILSLSVAGASGKSQPLEEVSSTTVDLIYVFILIMSAINGVGSSVLWVA